MTVVDLTTSPEAAPAALLDGLPRRVGLTLSELRHAASLAGGAPLPFQDVAPEVSDDRLGARLGAAGGAADTAYAAAVDSLPDPDDMLRRRGLLTTAGLEPGLAGALGLLATPRLALDLDLVVGPAQVRAWHRQRDGIVAALATADGLMFELTWCHTGQWADELTRFATLPEPARPDRGESDPAGPAAFRVPYELVDAAAETVAAGRPDVLPVLVAQAEPVTDTEGHALSAPEVLAALTSLTAAPQGRLRVLATAVGAGSGAPIAAISWVLSGDGWRALEPAPGAVGVLQVRPVAALDLASVLAPALAEVVS